MEAEANAPACLGFPYEHHVKLRTDNVQQRFNRELKRRGRIMGMNPLDGGKQEIVAECPMAELGDYAIKLRSMTQGRGSFVSQYERYDEAPVPVQEKVIAANKARLEALNKE